MDAMLRHEILAQLQYECILQAACSRLAEIVNSDFLQAWCTLPMCLQTLGT